MLLLLIEEPGFVKTRPLILVKGISWIRPKSTIESNPTVIFEAIAEKNGIVVETKKEKEVEEQEEAGCTCGDEECEYCKSKEEMKKKEMKEGEESNEDLDEACKKDHVKEEDEDEGDLEDEDDMDDEEMEETKKKK